MFTTRVALMRLSFLSVPNKAIHAAAIGPVKRLLGAAFAFCVLILLPSAVAALQNGTYRCWSYNVSGGGGGNCRLAPPITLRPDGSYEESATRGTYQLSGDRIHFSRSTIRGPGLIVAENQITFEYDYRNWRHTVTYLCQDCKSASVTAGVSAAVTAGTAPVRAEVRLEFPRSDGFLGWVNVAYLIPREHAAAFAASPLRPSNPPAGAVPGSAGRSDPQTISTLFKHARTEVDYVVFLESHSQRVAVASVRLPKTASPQPLTISASFDHEVR